MFAFVTFGVALTNDADGGFGGSRHVGVLPLLGVDELLGHGDVEVGDDERTLVDEVDQVWRVVVVRYAVVLKQQKRAECNERERISENGIFGVYQTQ